MHAVKHPHTLNPWILMPLLHKQLDYNFQSQPALYWTAHSSSTPDTPTPPKLINHHACASPTSTPSNPWRVQGWPINIQDLEVSTPLEFLGAQQICAADNHEIMTRWCLKPTRILSEAILLSRCGIKPICDDHCVQHWFEEESVIHCHGVLSFLQSASTIFSESRKCSFCPSWEEEAAVWRSTERKDV